VCFCGVIASLPSPCLVRTRKPRRPFMVVVAQYPGMSGLAVPKECKPSSSKYAPLPPPFPSVLCISDVRSLCSETPFFSASYDLWKRSEDDPGGRGPCPSMFPFDIVLPETFTDKVGTRALPPTHDVVYPHAADIRAKCCYLLRVVVRRKGTKLPIWKLPKK
jgi:hypothetical protein